jgi:TraM recognition site of TraD and TraG/Type IV secretion-system coupling protein DNA-binding domain
LIFRWFENAEDRDFRLIKELYEEVEASLSSIDLSQIVLELIPDEVDDLDARVDLALSIHTVFERDGTFVIKGDLDDYKTLSSADELRFRERLRRSKKAIERADTLPMLTQLLRWIIRQLYEDKYFPSDSGLYVPVIDRHSDPSRFLDTLFLNCVSREVMDSDLLYFERGRVNGLLLENKNKSPADEDYDSSRDLLNKYFKGSIFEEMLFEVGSYKIPKEARSEHTYILGGSGHGKTELLKQLILQDMKWALDHKQSILVMDSQGDLLDALLHHPLFHPEYGELRDKLVVIDPTDIDHPPALNLFAMKEAGSSSLENEKSLQSAIAQYEYLFGELLGAELTQRQGTLFSYLGRLMMEIPKATIHTLRDVLEHGEKYRPVMNRLTGSAKDFFSTKFFDASFRPVKVQIANRLWGVLGTSALDRMFQSTEMKVDFGKAFSDGKIILVNTSKELLKEEGSSFFGKFILSLVSHATIERASIPKDKRTPVSIYVDEAHEYLDQTLSQMFSQSRKYGISLTIAHQNLDQISTELRSSILSSTSVKIVGGVSSKDAKALASDMHTTSDFLSSKIKQRGATDFALYVKGEFSKAVSLILPFGGFESEGSLSLNEVEELRGNNRRLYSFNPTTQAQVVAEVFTPKQEVVIPKPLEGRGGFEHKALQQMIREAVKPFGYRAELEKKVADGFIDVLLLRGDEKIAAEITVSTEVTYELQNIQKCLAINPSEVWIVSNSKAKLDAIEKRYERQSVVPVHFLIPDQIPSRLTKPEPPKEETVEQEQVIRGYKVRVRESAGGGESDLRRRLVAGMMASERKG